MISAAQKAALLLLKLFSKVKLGVPYKMTNRGIAVFSGSNAVVAKILENKTAVFGQDVPIDLRISGNLVLDLSGSTAPGYLYILNEGSASITSELIGQISASNVIVQPSGNLISNNTQDSLYELQADVDNIFATRGIIREIQAGSNIGVIGGTSATASIFLSSSLTNITSIQTQELTASFVNASTAFLTNITGNLLGTASFATNADNANTVTNGVYTNTNNTFTAVNTFSNFYITGSITGSDAKFTTISGSITGSGAGLFDIPNGGLVNSSVTVGSTNITLGSAVTTLQGITVLTGSTVTGSTALFTQITGNLFGTSSFAANAGNANTVTNGVYTNINNTFTAVNTFTGFYITGSITGSDAKFTTISGSHTGSGAGLFDIPNGGLVNSSVTVGSTNIALGNTATTLQGITVVTGSTVTGSTALFTQITGAFSGNGANITNITASNISNFTNDVRGQFSAGTNITIVGGVISSTGSSGGTPGGTDQTVQFNSGSTFSGSTNLRYNYITNVLSGTEAQFTVITSSFTGSGAGLFGIPNSGLVNSSITIGTTNIALGETATTIQGISVLTGSTITGSIAQYTQITASSIRTAYITSSNIDTDYIDFNGINGEAPWQAGRLYYNTASNLLSVYTEVPNLHIHLGEQVVARVQNDLPITLAKGKVIQITGSTSSDTPRVITASWENDATSARTLAVVMEDIAVGARGYALLSGLLEGINTNAYQPGEVVYLSSSGNITNVIPPSPFHEVRIGQVVRKQTNNGSIFIRIQNGYELEELHDIDLVNIQNGDLLTYQTSPFPQWRNSKTLSGSYNITNALTASAIAATTISASQYIGITAGATPGGIDTSIQFNSGSSLSGSANLIYDYNTNTLSGTIARFNIVTSSFTGSGAGLFNITASGISNFTNDVRGQFSAGTNITIVGGVISSTGGGTGTPGGTDQTVQFNSGSTFSGSTNLIYNYTTSTLSGTTAQFTSITGSFSGSGAGLTNLPLSWTDYATRWDVAPTFVSASVVQYTLNGVTRYRNIPTPYTASADAFYSDINLTQLIVRRGAL